MEGAAASGENSVTFASRLRPRSHTFPWEVLAHQEETAPLLCHACCPAGVGRTHGSVWAPVGGGRAFFGIRADRLLEGLSHTFPWKARPHQEKTLSPFSFLTAGARCRRHTSFLCGRRGGVGSAGNKGMEFLREPGHTFPWEVLPYQEKTPCSLIRLPSISPDRWASSFASLHSFIQWGQMCFGESFGTSARWVCGLGLDTIAIPHLSTSATEHDIILINLLTGAEPSSQPAAAFPLVKSVLSTAFGFGEMPEVDSWNL